MNAKLSVILAALIAYNICLIRVNYLCLVVGFCIVSGTWCISGPVHFVVNVIISGDQLLSLYCTTWYHASDVNSCKMNTSLLCLRGNFRHT